MIEPSRPVRQAHRTSSRAKRHTVMAVVVSAYLCAAAIVVAVPHIAGSPRWLAVHLLGLGAASNAVFVWSRHFAQGLLHPRGSERAATVRLVALNVGVLGVLVGVTADVPTLGGVAAALVVAAAVAHVSSLIAMRRQGRPDAPLPVVVWFYVLAGCCLVVAGSLGGLMAGGTVADSSIAHERLHLAHAELNLLGWLGLAVLGTLVVLWPSALRTRMTEGAATTAWRTLVLCAGGLTALTAGSLAGSRPTASGGAALYAVGVGVSAASLLRTLGGRAPRSAAGWWLGAAVCWLFAGAVVDAVQLAGTTDPDAVLHPLVPLLGVGLVVQALVGALTFLLPVTLGGGPSGNRRLTAVLERGWPARVAAGNLGLLLVLLPASRAVHAVGWLGVLAGFASFLPLVGAGLLQRGYRGSRAAR